MRNIKFRIYDTVNKCFISDTSNFWVNPSFTAMMEWRPEFDGQMIFDLNDSLVFQQYTGLKDKNGVEIYEGDLLTYADNTTPEQIFEVKFLDERGTFVFRELYNPTFEGSDLPGWDDTILGQNAWDGWEIADAAKVIGNIFEGVDK